MYLVAPWLPFPLPSARLYEGETHAEGLTAQRCGDAAQAVEWFRPWAALALEPVQLERLRGMDLACWCKPGDPCHADVLLELANGAGS